MALSVPSGHFSSFALTHSLTVFRCCFMFLIPKTESSAFFSFLQIPTKQSPDPLMRIPGAAVMKIPHARLESSPPAGQLCCWPFIISRSASRKSLGVISRHRKSSEVWKAQPAAVGISTGSSAHSSSNPWFALS